MFEVCEIFELKYIYVKYDHKILYYITYNIKAQLN